MIASLCQYDVISILPLHHYDVTTPHPGSSATSHVRTRCPTRAACLKSTWTSSASSTSSTVQPPPHRTTLSLPRSPTPRAPSSSAPPPTCLRPRKTLPPYPPLLLLLVLLGLSSRTSTRSRPAVSCVCVCFVAFVCLSASGVNNPSFSVVFSICLLCVLV